MTDADFLNIDNRLRTIEGHLLRIVHALERLSPVPDAVLGPRAKPADIDALSHVSHKQRAQWDRDAEQPLP